jgi:DNA-binding SARP family transcriptional activator
VPTAGSSGRWSIRHVHRPLGALSLWRMVGTLLPPREASRSISGRIEARVLGGFEVRVGGRRLARADWQHVSAERLVKLLLVAPGHTLSREAAAETLWPEAEPEASRANLSKAIHFASRALDDPTALTAQPGRVGLAAELLDLDLDGLRAAFDVLADAPSRRDGGSLRFDESARDPDAGRAIDVILAYGPSELLPDDAYEDWLVMPRETLRARWERVALLAARRARELGMADQARAIADQLLDRDPTDEAAHRLVIELLAADGRHHAARRQFEVCRRALHDLLDTEPAPETVDAFRAAERTASSAPSPGATMPRLVARRAELERIGHWRDRPARSREALRCALVSLASLSRSRSRS